MSQTDKRGLVNKLSRIRPLISAALLCVAWLHILQSMDIILNKD